MTREALKLAQPGFFPQASTLFGESAAAELLAALPELRRDGGPPSGLVQVLLAGPPSSAGVGAAGSSPKEPPKTDKGEV